MFNFKLLHSAVHNIAFFSEKVVSSESGEKHAQIKYHLQAKIIQWRESNIMDYRLARKYGLKLQCFNDGFVSYKQALFLLQMLTDGLDLCGFISCSDSHSDGTHSLQSIQWWAGDATFLQICSDEETNSSTSWMA